MLPVAPCWAKAGQPHTGRPCAPAARCSIVGDRDKASQNMNETLVHLSKKKVRPAKIIIRRIERQSAPPGSSPDIPPTLFLQHKKRKREAKGEPGDVASYLGASRGGSGSPSCPLQVIFLLVLPSPFPLPFPLPSSFPFPSSLFLLPSFPLGGEAWQGDLGFPVALSFCSRGWTVRALGATGRGGSCGRANRRGKGDPGNVAKATKAGGRGSRDRHHQEEQGSGGGVFHFAPYAMQHDAMPFDAVP